MEATGNNMLAGQRVAYDHYVVDANSDPRVVPCIGRGELVSVRFQIRGVGACWLVDDDEDGSDLPVPLAHLWLDDHPSMSRFQRPSRQLLADTFFADAHRAIRAADSHTLFDLAMALDGLLNDVFGEAGVLDGSHYVSGVSLVEPDWSESSRLQLAGQATLVDETRRGDDGFWSRGEVAVAADMDLKHRRVTLRLVRRGDDWEHVSDVVL